MINAEALGRLVANIGRPGFDAAFFEFARQVLDISSCSAFVFEESRKPCPIILEGLGSEQRSRTRMLGSAYVHDGFRHDPQVLGLFEIADIDIRIVNPCDIGDTAFRGHYYEEPRIGSEIAVLARYRGKHYNIGFYRGTGKAPFDRTIIAQTEFLARVALPALHRHMELHLADPERADEIDIPSARTKPIEQTQDHLTAVLMAEGNGLSPREAQVCAAIILGYRTLAISLNLGISENTICTHRKRAYAKLGISSQNELFSRYFKTVTRLNEGASRTAPMEMVAGMA